MTGPTTSHTLLDRVRGGEAAAWSRFVELYGPVVYRLAKKKGFGRDEAEGLVQTFFVRMVEVMPKFEYRPDRGRFRKWVLTVALNEIRQHLRRQKRDAARLADLRRRMEDEGDAAVAEAVDEETGRWFDSAQAARLLQLAFDQLQQEISAAHFDVFRMLVLDQASPVQVAERFQMNRNQVDGIKFRNLRRIRAIAQRIATEWDDL